MTVPIMDLVEVSHLERWKLLAKKTYGSTYTPITIKFCPVFLTNHVELSRMVIMTTPSTMASSCVSNRLKLKPLITICENAPSPDVGSVVVIAIRQ